MTCARLRLQPSQRRARWTWWLLAACWLAGARGVHAQREPAPAPQSAAGEDDAAQKQRERAAKSAFQAGVEAAEAGDYARARDLFLRSRALVVKASTLLNLAVADLKLGMAEEALTELDALDASNPEQERLRERARELRAEAERLREREAAATTMSSAEPGPADVELAPRAQEVAASTTVAPPQAPPSLGPPRALLIAGGALVAAAVGGALWWGDRSRAVDACHKQEQQCLEHTQIERQERAAMATTLTLGAAGLGLVTGGAVWFAQRKHDQRTRTYVSAWISRAGGGAVLRTKF